MEKDHTCFPEKEGTSLITTWREVESSNIVFVWFKVPAPDVFRLRKKGWRGLRPFARSNHHIVSPSIHPTLPFHSVVRIDHHIDLIHLLATSSHSLKRRGTMSPFNLSYYRQGPLKLKSYPASFNVCHISEDFLIHIHFRLSRYGLKNAGRGSNSTQLQLAREDE